MSDPLVSRRLQVVAHYLVNVGLFVLCVGWPSSLAVRAQAQVAPGATFDAVSIRESPSRASSLVMRQHPSGYAATNATALDLIRYAFDVIEADLVGDLPDWAKTKKFDVVAKSSGDSLTYSLLRSMSRAMLQNRFRLDVSFERAEVSVYSLSMVRADGKTGPNLRPSTSKCGADPLVQEPSGLPVRVLTLGAACGVTPMTTGGGLSGLAGARVTMQQFARALTRYGGFDKPVLDQTGLSGEFDVIAVVSTDITGASSEARFVTAMREQLGLTLRSGRGALDVLRIRHIEEPSPN